MTSINPPLKHIKNVAKAMNKRELKDMSLMQVQHLLAKFLGYNKWGELVIDSQFNLQMKLNNEPRLSKYFRNERSATNKSGTIGVDPTES